MVTPWQARLALVGFLVVGSGITANLLLLQERRASTPTVKGQPLRAVPDAPVRARTLASPRLETKSQPAVATAPARPATAGNGKASSPRPVPRAKRAPAATASTR